MLALALVWLVTATQPAEARPAVPSAPAVTLRDFKLVGDLSGERASFTLTATACVDDRKGGSLELLSGAVALTEIGPHPKWRVTADQNRFILNFERRGEFPIEIRFDAAVRQTEGWNSLDFRVATSTLQPIILRGLPEDTQFEFAGAARPERKAAEFVSYLPADGTVKLSWKQVRPEAEGKLFFSTEMLSQISISPGLMRQVALLDFKVMQGELNRVTLLLHGAGEVTRVHGDQVLAWNLESVTNSDDRRLVVQLNQAQKDHFAFLVQMETPLGAFPQVAHVVQLRPEKATRFAGYLRVVNEGAVRLEVVQASGTSQISPDQFPETDATRAAFRAGGNQRFAYRFSGAAFSLRVQADQVLPELAVSQLLSYHYAENELAIDAEIELDIRDAPLRELLLRVPKGYAVARLNASGMNDYFLSDPSGDTNAELRLVYGQPMSGRQLVQLRLEHNQALGETNWTLPRIDVAKARSVRGFVGVAADPGFRLTPERTQSLTEIATAFFPGKLAGIQAAFRLSDPAWAATLHLERLPQTVQADVLHLFSIGEGIAYGSSVINYVVSGAPLATFKVELSDEYYNVEFTGKDLRSWQKTEGGYLVQLHTPVSGAYTLLATYERPFKAQGETLAFTGARPLDAQSEQGYTIVTSAYQFQVKPTVVSAGLLPLEPGEVPAEYRLFFDAPILAAYRYVARPFDLRLSLSPLAQGDSISQIVDRASLTTHVSKEGQVLTDARYFIKNRGNPHFRLTLPAGTELWSATVNGAAVVPVTDGMANLIPLPPQADPNAVLQLDLKLAMVSKDAKRIRMAAPILSAPVLLAEWRLEPDAGQRLDYRRGSLTPVGGMPEISGFAQLARMFQGADSSRAWTLLFALVVLVGAGMVVWRWAASAGAHRFSAHHLTGLLVGLIAFALVLGCLGQLNEIAGRHRLLLPADLTFLAPVEQTGSALNLELSNTADEASTLSVVGYAWPALLALAIWIYGWSSQRARLKPMAGVLGWALISWSALRSPNGVTALLWILLAFLLWNVVLPGLRHLWRLPPRPQPEPPSGERGAAPAAAALLLGGLVWLGWNGALPARAAQLSAANLTVRQAAGPHIVPDSVSQTIRVEDKFVFATAKIRWRAERDQVLPLLFEPAVLTQVSYPTRSLRLEQSRAGAPFSQQLVAERDGEFDIEVQYQLQVTKSAADSGFLVAVPYGLINQLRLTVANLDVDVFSPQAVSVQCNHAGTNTVADLVLSPADAWIGWKPRRRDVRREKPVFYADITQLYVPSAGVIEGAHFVSIRPAQGELGELLFNIPSGATVTEVLDPAQPAGAPGSLVSLWRFDPDARKLRVTLNPAQSRPFVLLIRSQVPTGPLPFQHAVGLVTVDNAAGQIGLLGVATGNEVQLDDVKASGFSPINLEDFPTDTTATLQSQVRGLTVRRAFRYSDAKATASLSASPVEPDVRVETQDTLSMGEDRSVLAVNAKVDVTRAGIFSLSFLMPAGFDVESISGSALTHWTELKSDAGRVITLHLAGKTEGKQHFAISLAGPGVKATNTWTVPQVVLREASKQRGTLLIVPEQGMRLQVASREGITQLDPQKAGIMQKGVLAFRILQTPSSLTLDIEQVAPWIQVASLQHANISDAQVKVIANLQYQIENTGLKAFHVLIPTNADSVRFLGEQVADFLKVPDVVTNGLQEWEVKLHRRVIGQYLLQVLYETAVPSQATQTSLRGVEAADVNLQRGFVTVESNARLQLTVAAPPAALQPTEWQSIPRALRQDLQASAASLAYRLVEPSFELPLKLQRHQAAKLLAARIINITFNSVISDDGIMLTQVRLNILPGDKRLLHVTLPKDARFWFAFVNDNGVWPWRDQSSILIPLEQQSRSDKPVPVEVYYSCRTGSTDARALDLELLAPKFDLPLENLTWRVSLSDKWQVTHWTGSLQLQRRETIPQSAAVDLQTYLQSENTRQRERTKEAEDFMAAGNNALADGRPQQARRAFQAAFGLSAHDAAFNEDARVQLHNIKLQQALVGLNVRQSAAAGDTGALGDRINALRNRKEMNYTQQDVKDLIDRNSADENSTLMRLAERLIQQQDAASSSPAVIRATIPEQGRVLTFTRSVVVEDNADLKIGLQAVAARAASSSRRMLTMAAIIMALALFAALGRFFRRPESA